MSNLTIIKQNHLGARRDQSRHLVQIEVRMVGAAVREHDPGALPHKGQRRGHERVGRHDDFVAGADVRQDGRHFQGVGAAGRQQDLAEAAAAFEEFLAAPGKQAVAGNLAGLHGLADVVGFFAGQERLVERDGNRRLHFDGVLRGTGNSSR